MPDREKIKSAFPVSSCGLPPGLVPDVLDIFGTGMVLLFSGGIHSHQQGTPAGAKATMQAVVVWHKGVTLEEKAKKVKDLKESPGRWGYYKRHRDPQSHLFIKPFSCPVLIRSCFIPAALLHFRTLHPGLFIIQKDKDFV